MPTLFIDDNEVRKIIEGSERHDPRITECWDGLTVVPPMKDNDLCKIQTFMCVAFGQIVDRELGERAYPGCNVSDRGTGWLQNYRCPHFVVYLHDNPAINHNTHWEGGPDFLVQILSPCEDPKARFDFYAAIGTREVLVVDRKPWALELFRLKRGKLVSVGRSELPDSTVLKSNVLPFTFQLKPGKPRPTIEMTHTTTGQVWKA